MPSSTSTTWLFVGAVAVATSSGCEPTPARDGATTTPTSPPSSSASAPGASAPTRTTDAQDPVGSAQPPTAAGEPNAPAIVVDEMTRAQIAIAEVEGLALKNAATIFLAQRGKCAPDVATLVQGGFVANASPDPWGGDYRLECGADGETMKVHSNGPDGRRDTADDVHVE